MPLPAMLSRRAALGLGASVAVSNLPGTQAEVIDYPAQPLIQGDDIHFRWRTRTLAMAPGSPVDQLRGMEHRSMEDALPTRPDVRPMMVPRALIAGVIAALAGCSSYSNCDLATCDDGGRIAVDVQNRYARSPGLQMDRLNVQCVDHVVYLYGLVDTQRESDEAVAVARATPGVWRVESTIAVMNSRF